MRRLSRIHQMTDEELEEFLSKVADKGNSRDMLLPPGFVRDMAPAVLGVYLLALDMGNILKICRLTQCPVHGTAGCGAMADVCSSRWLRAEGPLMDGEGV